MRPKLRASPAATPINDALNAAALGIAFVVLTILLLWLLTVAA